MDVGLSVTLLIGRKEAKRVYIGIGIWTAAGEAVFCASEMCVDWLCRAFDVDLLLSRRGIKRALA